MGNVKEVHELPSSYTPGDMDKLADVAAKRFADDALHKYYANYYRNYYAQQMAKNLVVQDIVTKPVLTMQPKLNPIQTPAFSMPSETDGKTYRKYLLINLSKLEQWYIMFMMFHCF